MVAKLGSVSSKEGRLYSLDFFRGFVMFLLIAEYTNLYNFLTDSELQGSILYSIGTQFHHHPWHGLRAWDLVQPFFMFIVGVAIPFAVRNRLNRGDQYSDVFKHALKRSFLLLLFGWGLYCIGPGQITFRFHNVLSQLSVTYLIAFLLMRYSSRSQFSVSIILLAITEIAYRFFPVAGYNQPFVADLNFGTWIDMMISGEVNGGHWVVFNAIPTAAHTIWGVIAGQLLMSKRGEMNKLKILIIAGVVGLMIGYSLDFYTPIIKRIATTSFVIVSAGWSLLALALSYWFIDVKKIKDWSRFFAIVGMNSIFIYVFAEVGGGDFLYRIVKPFSMGLFSWMGVVFAQIIDRKSVV